MQHSTRYILLFAAAVCGICSVFVAGAAVLLKDRQEVNVALDRQKKVLTVAGLMQEGESVSRAEVTRLFDENIVPEVVDLEHRRAARRTSTRPTFDQRKATADPATSHEAPPNPAKVRRLPKDGLVYRVVKDGKLQAIIIPIEGKGLWSTLYGFLALARRRAHHRRHHVLRARRDPGPGRRGRQSPLEGAVEGPQGLRPPGPAGDRRQEGRGGSAGDGSRTRWTVSRGRPSRAAAWATSCASGSAKMASAPT